MQAPTANVTIEQSEPAVPQPRRASSPSIQASARAEPHLEQLVVVSCYTRFDNLAHGPRGSQAEHGLYTFYMDPSDGQMVLLSVTEEGIMNPAFMRFHPRKNMLYACTESVAEAGEIVPWSVCPKSGRLTKLGSSSAHGTSTCYLTLDKECENMLVVNYWNATIGVFGLSGAEDDVLQLRSMYNPNSGREMHAKQDKHVNHSNNDQSAQKERQSDPHSHAVILDPYFGRIAYVPDLGMDIIRQFRYDQASGSLAAAGSVKSGPEGRSALGPRYIEFHPTLPLCYVVNELSSEVSVFHFDHAAAESLMDAPAEELESAAPTLRLVQTRSTIPDGFDGELNTCGRIAVHPSGNFVLVSNRGHDSIAVFQVSTELPSAGCLLPPQLQHTRGATPRHFQFDGSGQWVIVANQDSDNITVFRLNLATGRLEWTGHVYSIPSPNFVCSVLPHQMKAAPSRRSASLRRRSATGKRSVTHSRL